MEKLSLFEYNLRENITSIELFNMKKLPNILSILSIVGVITVLIIVLTENKSASVSNSLAAVKKSGSSLNIAYILTDSVLVNYQLAIDLNEEFTEQQKQFTDEFTQKRSSLEEQAAAFQEKVQRGGFLTQERAMQERDRILGQEQEVQQLDYEMSSRLSELEAKINAQLVDSIMTFVKEYNKTQQYDYIFSNSGQIIVGDQQYNISKAILEGLNRRYANSK